MPHLSHQDRALWAAVVAQAKDDVENLPLNDLDYHAAVAFLTSNAAFWRRGRAEVAAHLGFAGDDIQRAGIAWVIARRRSEGLPDHPPAPARKAPEEVTTVVTVAPRVSTAALARVARRQPRPPEFNPFSKSWGGTRPVRIRV